MGDERIALTRDSVIGFTDRPAYFNELITHITLFNGGRYQNRTDIFGLQSRGSTIKLIHHMRASYVDRSQINWITLTLVQVPGA